MNPTHRKPLDTPLPGAAAWLFNGAKRLGIAEQAARNFARSGELQLPGLTLRLMLLTGGAVALAPQGSCLQSRWDSTGLDGEDFADWLLDVAQLAGSFVAPSHAALPKRNPTWT